LATSASLSVTNPAGWPPEQQTLTRRRKAAMIIQLLLSDGQALPLSRLPEAIQVELTRELGALRMIDHDTLTAVAEEFARDLERVGMTAPDGVAGALAALSAHLSPGAANRLRAEAAQSATGDPWPDVLALPDDEIKRLLLSESMEVAAIVLSKLPVARAAYLLGQIPGERARRITYAVSQTAEVTPVAVARIGRGLAMEYCARPVPAFAAAPVERVGAILNSSGAATRDTVLEGLTAQDPDFADEVRRAIFTFRDIPARLDAAEVPKVARALDAARFVTVLAYAVQQGGAEAEVAEYLLSNLSQRMADNLREEMRERGHVKRTEGEGAQSELVAAIRSRADTGEIRLKSPGGEEED
jgi:flagellar motor switch protein FliG